MNCDRSVGSVWQKPKRRHRLEIAGGIANRNVACRCSSVSLHRKTDLLIFIGNHSWEELCANVRIAKLCHESGSCRD